jgi:hypothetical protein
MVGHGHPERSEGSVPRCSGSRMFRWRAEDNCPTQDSGLRTQDSGLRTQDSDDAAAEAVGVEDGDAAAAALDGALVLVPTEDPIDAAAGGANHGG